MAATLHVDVVSAEEQIYSGEAEFVVLPGVEGELGIFPRHTPLFTAIRPGAVRIKVPGVAEEEFVFVQGGFLEVQPTRVTVLADGDHVIKRIVARARDEAEAMRRRCAATAPGAPQRGARHHAAAIVLALRRLPAIDLAAALRALRRFADERRIERRARALRVGVLQLAFVDEPGLHRSPFATPTV